MQNDTQSNEIQVQKSADGISLSQSASHKASVFGATPVIQQAGAGETTGFTAGSGTAALDDSVHTGNVGTAAYTVSDIVKALKNYGILAQ